MLSFAARKAAEMRYLEESLGAQLPWKSATERGESMSEEHNAGPVRKRAVVYGTVQGVGYRFSAQAEAQRLGIAGTVRNRYDGTVETEAEGDAEAVDAYVAWLRKGPRWSNVTAVDVVDVEPKGESDFSIR